MRRPAAIKAGKVGVAGATGAVLDRSLVSLSHLIDRTLTEVRLAAGEPALQRVFSLSDFIAEVKLSASLEAQVRDCALTVSAVAPELAVDADRDLLFAAVGNLLQNAFKFTRPQSEVRLNAYGADNRIHVDVEDNCGGLPPGDPEALFLPFKRGSADNTGLGLGLSLSRNSVVANRGTLTVRDKPGHGYVFTIDLPLYLIPEPSFASGAVGS